MKLPLTSSQIVASVLGAGVLLSGAFALGRAQSGATTPSPSMTTASDTGTADVRVAPSVSPVAAADTPARVSICKECARVLAVHEERREGHASGLGAVGGALVGGLLGHQVGGGNGKTLATVAGAVGGGWAGNEIEKRGQSHAVWVLKLSHPDGSTQSLEQAQNPGVVVGDVVVIRDGRVVRRA